MHRSHVFSAPKSMTRFTLSVATSTCGLAAFRQRRENAVRTRRLGFQATIPKQAAAWMGVIFRGLGDRSDLYWGSGGVVAGSLVGLFHW